MTITRTQRMPVPRPALSHGHSIGRAVVMLSCSLLCGCALDIARAIVPDPTFEDVSALPAAELERLQQVTVFSSDQGLTYSSSGKAKGVSCKQGGLWRPALSAINGDTPQETAMNLLKLKVIRAGGNAVLSPVCVHHDWLDLPNNCWESWVCEGQAVRVP